MVNPSPERVPEVSMSALSREQARPSHHVVRHAAGATLLAGCASLALFGVAMAQELGLRGTADVQDDGSGGGLQQVSSDLLIDPTNRPPTDPYATSTESDADLERRRYDRVFGVEPGDTEAEEDTDESARTAATPRDRQPDLASRQEPGVDAELQTGTIQQIGPDGRPLPRGAVITDDGTVLTGAAADRYRYQRALRETAAAAQNSRDLNEEDNPFNAPGIRAGSMILRPTLDQGIEYSTNGNSTPGGSDSVLSVTTLGVTAESEWRRGSLGFTGSGTWRETLSGAPVDQPELNLGMTMSQPIGRDWQWDGALRYSLQREAAVEAADPNDTLIGRPLAQAYGATLGVSRIDGSLRPGFEIDIARTNYGNGVNANGLAVSQRDRDQTAFRGTARLGYAISPALTPFVALSATRTLMDVGTDRGGINRNSTQLRGTVGVDINLSEKLSGSLSAGYVALLNDDARITDLGGFAGAASLAWSPIRGTTVNASFETTVEPGTANNESAVFVHSGTIGLTHALSQRFSVTGTLGGQWRDAKGSGRHDQTLSAELAGTWYLNRYMGVTGRARHAMVTSSQPGRASDTTTLYLGMRLQR